MGGCFQHFHFSSSFILQPRFNKLQFQHQHELPQAVLPPVEPPRISNFSCLGQDRCTNLLPWMPSKIVRLKYQLNRPSHYGVEMEKQRGIRHVVPAISTRPLRSGSVLGKDISAVWQVPSSANVWDFRTFYGLTGAPEGWHERGKAYKTVKWALGSFCYRMLLRLLWFHWLRALESCWCEHWSVILVEEDFPRYRGPNMGIGHDRTAIWSCSGVHFPWWSSDVVSSRWVLQIWKSPPSEASKDVLPKTEAHIRPILWSFGESKGSWVQLRVFLFISPCYGASRWQFLEGSKFDMANIEWSVIFEGASERLGNEQLLHCIYGSKKVSTSSFYNFVCFQEAPSWYFSWKERLRFGRAWRLQAKGLRKMMQLQQKDSYKRLRRWERWIRPHSSDFWTLALAQLNRSTACLEQRLWSDALQSPFLPFLLVLMKSKVMKSKSTQN